MATSSPSLGCVPDHPSLTGDAASAAVKHQIAEYPRVIRGDKDLPVPQQCNGLISLALFKQPVLSKSGKPVYGFCKLRGNWVDLNQAKNQAAEIVRTQDSANKIRVVNVGEWFPITNEDGMSETVDVRVDIPTEEQKLKELAIKERDQEQRRIMRELKEREDEVKNSKDYNDDTEDIDYYTMKRITWLRLHENVQLFRKKINDLEEKWKKTRKELSELEGKHPEYKTSWIDNYNKERKKSGIPNYIPGDEEEKLYELNLV